MKNLNQFESYLRDHKYQMYLEVEDALKNQTSEDALKKFRCSEELNCSRCSEEGEVNREVHWNLEVKLKP